MTSCPWCGTRYDAHRSNCDKCGGLIPLADKQSGGAIPKPPVAPRPFAGHYAWWLMSTDAWAIAALVLAILALCFILLAFLLIFVVVTAPLAIFFALTGLLFLGAGAGVIIWRYQNAQKILEVMRSGEVIEGKIVQVRKITAVRVNRRHPSAVQYKFQIDGQTYTGDIRTFKIPGPAHQPGQPTLVLYLPHSPQWNTLYPHP